MPHYNRYESFKIKKRKHKAKTIDTNFTLTDSKEYGIVIETKYQEAQVLYKNKIVKASLNNKNKQNLNQIIFPGDKVTLSKNNETYTITNILDRTQLLSRIKTDRTRNTKIIKSIAANIDLAVIVVSAKEPPLHSNLIDRYLIILQNNNIDTIICLNKCELKTQEEQILDIYKKLNIKVIETSTVKNIGIDNLKQHLKNKQAIFLGHSGVGKSSLLNSIMNEKQTKTSKISPKSKKGRHTTTSSKYYTWEKNSSIIDTPGIRSLDTSSIKKEDIKEYFPEFNNSKCKYKDCNHHHEPLETCQIKQKVKDGYINKQRYESYIRMIED